MVLPARVLLGQMLVLRMRAAHAQTTCGVHGHCGPEDYCHSQNLVCIACPAS